MAVEWEAPIEGMTPISFGSSEAAVKAVLLEQFPNLSYTDSSNWADFAVVADGSGDYLRTRSDVGGDSKKAFTVIVPQANTYYARYKIMFESAGGSNHPSDEGFDWGDGNSGTPKTWSTGGKLPGMMKGSPGDNTGGIIDPSVWSGRLMWRGVNSAGVGGNARTSVTLSEYFYGEEANGETGLGAANTYWFVGSFAEDPTRFGSNGGSGGTGDGQYGDPRAFDIPVDTWIDILIGYHAPDNNTGFFKAWTMVDGVDTTWQEQLHIPNMRYMGPGNQGIDGFLFQNFWGGATIDWRPDNIGYMRYKDFGVYTTESSAMEAFGAVGAVPFEITSPSDLAVGVTSPVTISGTAADDGAQGYEVLVEDVTNTVVLDDYGDTAVTFTGGTETWVTDSGVTVPSGGETVRVTPRRWS